MFEKNPLQTIRNTLVMAFSFVPGEISRFWTSPAHKREWVGTTNLRLMEDRISLKVLLLAFLENK